MDPVKVDEARFRTAFVLILVLLISGLFLAVAWPFLQALLVGAMLAGWLVSPLVGVDTINQNNFSLAGLLVSFVGAAVLLAAMNLIRRGKAR